MRPKPRPAAASVASAQINGNVHKTKAMTRLASAMAGMVSSALSVLLTAMLSGTVPSKKKSTGGMRLSNLGPSVFDFSRAIFSRKIIGCKTKSTRVIGNKQIHANNSSVFSSMACDNFSGSICIFHSMVDNSVIAPILSHGGLRSNLQMDDAPRNCPHPQKSPASLTTAGLLQGRNATKSVAAYADQISVRALFRSNPLTPAAHSRA